LEQNQVKSEPTQKTEQVHPNPESMQVKPEPIQNKTETVNSVKTQEKKPTNIACKLY